MIKTPKTEEIRKFYPEHEVRAVDGGFLLTPKHSRVFPREPLIIDRQLYLDPNGNPINGPVPIDLMSGSLTGVTDHIIADLHNHDVNLQGKPRNLLFLRATPFEDTIYYHVAQPALATHFYIITSWDRDRESFGPGASKNYAAQHGAVRFYKHRPKSAKSGRDFWVLPINFLSPDVISYFDQKWQSAVNQAIDAHAQRYPKDASVYTHRQRLTPPNKRTEA